MKNLTHEEHTSRSRVARMVNALTFAIQSHELGRLFEDRTRQNLQGVHSVWLLGGYLYEAIHLVDDLSTQYGREARFKRLEQFARYSRPYRELFAEMNLNPAFNMDWGGDTTRKQIASLGNSTLYREPQKLDEGVVYPGIYKLDIHYLEDKCGEFVPPEEMDGLIRHGLITYACQFIEAGIEFIGEKPGSEPIDLALPETGEEPQLGQAAAAAPIGFRMMPLDAVNGEGIDEEEVVIPEPNIDPEIMAKIFATCDPNEVHSRVPVCFGGDHDPDAWHKQAE